ncbi:MAG: hypothetical protein MUE54_10880 [Anaerolineae bacterium]|jgi:hypothetical protein|nr:hypothetical protein [Anaerolineae bacterium]
MDMQSLMNTPKRRKVEDEIIASFRRVNFNQKKHAYLEDEIFWDYIFAWHELVKYYEMYYDTALGQNMLQLYQECIEKIAQAVNDTKLHDRRRDRASMAIYQLNFYMTQIVALLEGHANSHDDSIGTLPPK